MIVVLEGPDCSGKTTLARALCEARGLTYHHEGPPPKDISPLTHYSNVLSNCVEAGGKGVVIDRFALGERVYGPIFRGEDGLGEDGWDTISRYMWGMGVIEVVCLPDPVPAFDVFLGSHPEFIHTASGSHFNWWETYARFAYYANLEPERFIVFDYRRHTLKDVIGG